MTSATVTPVTPEGARESRPPRPLRSFWFHLLVGAGIGAIVAALTAIVFCVVAGANAEATHPDPQERTAFLQSLGMAGLLMFASTFGPMGVLFGALTGAVVRIVRGALGERPVPDVPRGPQLTDAMIDARGDIYARGSIEPPPTLGIRMPAGADLLRIETDGSGNWTIGPARARRNTQTGYLDGRSFGPTVRIEAPAATDLRAKVADPEWPQLPLQGPPTGSIRVRDADGATSTHVLTDIRYDVRSHEGASVVELSAVLAAQADSSRSGAAESSDPWRLIIRFSVDAITREVAFEPLTGDAGGESTPRRSAARRSLHAPQLATAPIGASGGIWGITPDGRLQHVVDSGALSLPSIYIWSAASNRRRRSGLVPTGFEFARYPKLLIRGISLTAIVAELRSDDGETRFETEASFDLDHRPEDNRDDPLHGPPLGYVELYLRADPQPSDDFHATWLRALVDEFGMTIEYRCEAELQTFEGEFVIPWEVLTLRFPGLRAHRDALLAPVPGPRSRRAQP
jgi:hypothetical protein